MNAHVHPSPALRRSLPDIVAEYDRKRAAIADAIAAFKAAGAAVQTAGCVGGEYGDVSLKLGHVDESDLEKSLLKSAWKHVYNGLQIDRIASADDKRKWKQALESPAPFTLGNIRATLGDYHLNPRQHILRGLAEVFCSLDQSYKSHDKVKIGVAGLPKRVILSNVSGWGSYGRDKLRDIVNAIAQYRGEPVMTPKEFEPLDALHSYVSKRSGECTIRGLRIKKFENGNGHVFFDRGTLRDVNKALAEYYGEVLPDAAGEKPTQRTASTAVSTELQFYPTPAKLADDVLRHHFSDLKGKRVLDPSCGDGRLLTAARKLGAHVLHGVEVDRGRAMQTLALGFNVYTGNFLECVPDPDNLYDIVYMNPPFYGRHYAKHVRHALKFLKPGGVLLAILPVTAREHGELDDLIPKPRWSCDSAWRDLPVGSFSESGTNVNTTTLLLSRGAA